MENKHSTGILKSEKCKYQNRQKADCSQKFTVDLLKTQVIRATFSLQLVPE
jgi:hypothetical protein